MVSANNTVTYIVINDGVKPSANVGTYATIAAARAAAANLHSWELWAQVPKKNNKTQYDLKRIEKHRN